MRRHPEADTTFRPGRPASDLGAVGTLDSSEVHEISVEFDEADYEAMIETYSSTNEKDWIEATVTIDGATYEQAGIRLKGNSSLRSIAGRPAVVRVDPAVRLDPVG